MAEREKGRFPGGTGGTVGTSGRWDDSAACFPPAPLGFDRLAPNNSVPRVDSCKGEHGTIDIMHKPAYKHGSFSSMGCTVSPAHSDGHETSMKAASIPPTARLWCAHDAR